MGADLKRKIGPWQWRPSWMSLAVAGGVVLCYVGALLAVASYVGDELSSSSLSLSSVRQPWLYSLKISALSAVVCGVLAPPMAWALMQFRGPVARLRPLLVLPYCLPSVAVGGLLVLTFGRSGVVNDLLVQIGATDEPLQFLYRNFSPLLGTTWMNLPLGIFLLLNRWESVPGEIWFQANALEFSRLQKLRFVVWPYSRSVFIGWLGVVFLACLNSFGLMMMLAGSLSATTLELATWQALFLEADWGTAALLMSAQLFTSVAAVWLLATFLKGVVALDFSPTQQSPKFSIRPRDFSNVHASALGFVLILPLLAFYGLPVAALGEELFAHFRAGIALETSDLTSALSESLANAGVAAVLTVLLVSVLVPNQIRARNTGQLRSERFLSLSLWAAFIVPGMVMVFALLGIAIRWESLLVRRVMLWLAQALQILPPAAAVYAAAWSSRVAGHDHTAEEFGMSQWNYWRLVVWPAMAKPTMIVAVLAGALSISDIAVVSMLSDSQRPPLTLLIARLMGSYQFAEASLAIGLLIGISGLAFGIAGLRRESQDA